MSTTASDQPAKPKPRKPGKPGKKTRRSAGAPLAPQPRADAPLDSQAFLRASQPVLRQLEDDLLARARASAGVTEGLRARHADERERGHTAAGFDEWQRRLVTQVAAAWLLSAVFVRTLEDRGLLGRNRIAGPGALDSQKLFFDMAPSLTEREYLLAVFRELSRLPGVRDTFDAHNPAWKLMPSAEATRALLALFRAPDPEAPAYRFGQEDTRFLGDLYQDLSEDVRKRYALLQTPDFVERFILDRTLERAVARFGVSDTTVIDPTCGSGHFLLGAFERLYDHWLRYQPDLDERQAAAQALDAVFGADINPYAVAIARFRLTLAFLHKGGYTRLHKNMPRLPLHLVVADSLLHNPQHTQASFADLEGQSARTWGGEEFALDDEAAARDVLHRRFAAVVGNPPYITVKDKVLRDRYREAYTSAAKQYSLAAPFTERFFQLARSQGYVGMINANSFMKREFGKKLIQEYLPTVNLDLIVNTAGAYIPGHGTPTVLLFGTSEAPQETEVLSVLSKRGEPTTPDKPEKGLVWQSIAEHWYEEGFENEFISVARIERDSLAKHPWSLAGGGATELKKLLEQRATSRLGDLTTAIGFSVITGEDNCLASSQDTFGRLGVSPPHMRRLVVGEEIRDWSIADGDYCIWPNTAQGERLTKTEIGDVLQYLWPYRQILKARKAFGVPVEEKGIPWWALREVYAERMQTPLTIAFAFVATHNHFVLDRGGKVFNRSAPIIKLPETATEDDHLALLAYLNSSTAAFFYRQAGHSKGAQGVNEGHKSEIWEQFLEYSGTLVASTPVPPPEEGHDAQLRELGRQLDRLAQSLQETMPDRVIAQWEQDRQDSLTQSLAQARSRYTETHEKMVGLQEEIDWTVYRAFGLLDAQEEAAMRDTTASADALAIAAGMRPFEVLLRRHMQSGTRTSAWLERNRYVQDGEWSPEIRSLMEARAQIACTNKFIGLLEQPEFKHRWTILDFEQATRAAARSWLLDKLEECARDSASTMTSRDFLAHVQRDQAFSEISMLVSEAGNDATELTAEALAREAVPFLSVLRYSATGLEKHQAWQSTWELQRREDAGEKVGDIPVPPKYTSKDYANSAYWRHRGKLDVPKERFISYPGCESEHDGLPVYGWAGWNHLQRLQALALLYQDRKNNEDWPTERLVPMLAGMLELLPWVKQWHNDPDPGYDGLRMGDYFETFVHGQCSELDLTLDDLRAWRPPRRTRGRRKNP